ASDRSPQHGPDRLGELLALLHLSAASKRERNDDPQPNTCSVHHANSPTPSCTIFDRPDTRNHNQRFIFMFCSEVQRSLTARVPCAAVCRHAPGLPCAAAGEPLV